MSGAASPFDGMMALLAMIGFWPVLRRLGGSTSLTPVEKRLRGIMWSLALLFALRIPHYGMGWESAGGPAYAAASLAAFMTFLFFESLLRRHMPVVLKIWMTAGCLGFGAAALAGRIHLSREGQIAFGGFLLVSSVWTLLACLARDRREYNFTENRFIDLCSASLMILGPFFLSDIPAFQVPPVPRLGAMGALLFAATSIYSESIFQRKSRTFRHLLQSLVYSLFLTSALVVLLPNPVTDVVIQIFTMMMSINLVFQIWRTVEHLRGDDPQSKFVRGLVESDKSSRGKFLSELHRFFGDVEAKLISSSDFKGHPVSDILAFFDARQVPAFSLHELRESVLSAEESGMTRADIDSAEVLIDVLESSGMNHICLVDRAQGLFVVVSVTAIGYSQQVRLRAGVIADMVALLPR